MGDDLASPIRCGVDHRAADRDAGSSSLFVKGKGGRETGDPSTDNGDCSKIGHDVGQREDSCALGTETTVSASESESINIGHTCVVFVSRLRGNSGYTKTAGCSKPPLADFFSILLALTQLMHHVDSRGYMFDRCRREDPMAQVEDMSRTTAGPAQNIFHAPFDFMQGRKQC